MIGLNNEMSHDHARICSFSVAARKHNLKGQCIGRNLALKENCEC